MLKNIKPSRLDFETGIWLDINPHKELQLYLPCRETIKTYLWHVCYLDLVELGDPNEDIPFANLCHN